jgi:hypothetical protein
MMASTNCDDSPDLISVCTPIDNYIRRHQYDSKCTSRKNWFDLAGIPYLVFEHEPLNALQSIEAILAESSRLDPLEADFWEQSMVPSPWNIYWTDAARDGGGLDLNHPVFGQHWTRYTGA